MEAEERRGDFLARVGNNCRRRGAQYENLAAEYLEREGLKILQRNFYSYFGEVDLVARDGKYLVFVEVKYRQNSSGGHPLEAVGARKRQRICRTADYYCLRNGYDEETPCRFDVVGILGQEIIHIRDAFLYCKGSGTV